MGKEVTVFKIEVAGHKNGLRDYRFDLDKSILKYSYDDCEIVDLTCKIDIKATRFEKMIQLECNLNGSIITPCDRCLDLCEVAVQYSTNFFIKFDDKLEGYSEENENIYFARENREYVDLEDFFYDMFILSIPARRIHDDFDLPESKCNSETLKILEKHKRDNFINSN